MDLKHIENRVEGLTRHLLALADEAQHVIARADAQLDGPGHSEAAGPTTSGKSSGGPASAEDSERVVVRRSPREKVWSRGAICAAAARKAEVAKMARLPAASATLGTAGVPAPGPALAARVEASSRTMSGTGTGGSAGAGESGVASLAIDAEDAGVAEIKCATDISISVPGATLTFTQVADPGGPQPESGGDSGSARDSSTSRCSSTSSAATSVSHAFQAHAAGTSLPQPQQQQQQPYPHTITLCLEPLRERTEEALRFLYEDPKAVHRGITYLDYPGSDRAEKRMNFAMFRRGLHGFNRHCGDLEGRALKQRLHKLSEQNRENGKKHKGTKRRRD